MSGVPAFINNLLWGKNPDYFREPLRLSAPCFSFFVMQVVRFIMILGLIGVWGINFYVNVKKCFMYLNFWALTLTFLYMLCIFTSAGRQEVEHKLAQANKIQDEEKSRSWKRAVFLHSTAWPITVTSVVLFSVFFMNDQLCSTQLDFGFAEWRRVVVFIATYFPMFVLLIDFSMNRLVSSHSHFLTTLVIFLLYLFGAFIGQEIQNRPIYAGHLAFQRSYSNDYDYNDAKHQKYTGVDLQKFEFCKDTYLPSQWNQSKGEDDESFTVIDWSKKLWITLGTGLGTLLLTHLFITIVSQCRLSKSPKSDKPASAPLIGQQ